MIASLIRTLFFSLILCGGVGYAGYVLYPTVAGPRVAVVTPHDFSVSETGALTLTGSADHFATLTMNGRRIITHPDGTFGERMLLTPGSNTFVFEATDHFGTSHTQQITVVYTPKTERQTETARIVPLEETLSF